MDGRREENGEVEAYEGQGNNSLQARCHLVGLSRALTGALITLGPETCAGR